MILVLRKTAWLPDYSCSCLLSTIRFLLWLTKLWSLPNIWPHLSLKQPEAAWVCRIGVGEVGWRHDSPVLSGSQVRPAEPARLILGESGRHWSVVVVHHGRYSVGVLQLLSDCYFSNLQGDTSGCSQTLFRAYVTAIWALNREFGNNLILMCHPIFYVTICH